MDQGTFELLWEADWGTIRRELLAYATWRARNYRWHRGDSVQLAEGKTVEDVVQEVIVKALNGIRRWDPDKGQLLPWLQAQSRSVIDALAKSAPHRRETSEENEERLVYETGYYGLRVSRLATGQSSDPLEIVLKKEAKAQIEQKVDALFQAVDGEPELKEVLEAIMNDCEPKARCLAQELGVPVEDVYNRLRRLRRRASKLMKEEDSSQQRRPTLRHASRQDPRTNLEMGP